MISIYELSLYFGGQDVFDSISITINKGDKIGLVGKNGAGKSTLLNVIAGKIRPNAGTISLPKDIKLGYLTQDIDFEDGCSVVEEAKKVFKDIILLENEINNIIHQLESQQNHESEKYIELINNLQHKQHQYEILDGYQIESSISQVLLGLGFLAEDFQKMTHQFSGGWRMRIELAKILLQKPDIMLLDEPTNHLDIESIIWLEGWLKKYNGALVLVSHDKRFLDNVTNRTVEIAFRKCNDYKAPYSKYLLLREERVEKQTQAKKNQDKYIQETKELINKFRAKKNKAAFAQTLIKKLEKVERIEVEQEDFSKLQFRFPPAPHAGKISMTLQDVSKNYDQLTVLQAIDLQIMKGEKIALVGKNGEGKTTLLKIMVGELSHQGKVKLGHQIQLGYYAQNQSEYLDEDVTILQCIQQAAPAGFGTKVRDILGSFLFSNEDVEKKIGVLSGGERARVSLCKLLLEPRNLLIMDEPTNHLDIASKDILKRALKAYDGTLILVSHDRDFLQGLTEKVYEVKQHNIKEHVGDIGSYLNAKKNTEITTLRSITKPEETTKTDLKNDYKEEKENRKKQKSVQNKLNNLEKQIDELEKELKHLDIQLTDPKLFQQYSKEKGFFESYQQKQNKLQNLMQDWEKMTMDLEN